jgi:hypothetical protein
MLDSVEVFLLSLSAHVPGLPVEKVLCYHKKDRDTIIMSPCGVKMHADLRMDEGNGHEHVSREPETFIPYKFSSLVNSE